LKNSASWLTWIIVAGLLIFAGIASAVVPLVIDEIQGSEDSAVQLESGPTETKVDISELPFVGSLVVEIGFIQDNIQGRTITLLQAFGIILGAVLVGVGALAVPLAGITMVYSRQLNKVTSDESYQTAVSEIERREKEFVKSMAEQQPPKTEDDPQVRSLSSALIIGFLIVTLVWITAYTVGVSILEGGTWDLFGLELSAGAFSGLVALITAIILIPVFRSRHPVSYEEPESENEPVNWGTIWVIVTGFIVVGIGAGIAIFFTTSG
jgi:hypothetical protein